MWTSCHCWTGEDVKLPGFVILSVSYALLSNSRGLYSITINSNMDKYYNISFHILQKHRSSTSMFSQETHFFAIWELKVVVISDILNLINLSAVFSWLTDWSELLSNLIHSISKVFLVTNSTLGCLSQSFDQWDLEFDHWDNLRMWPIILTTSKGIALYII